MPEQKVYDLTVDSEFRDLIPPLNEEELKLLEASLVADGCESAAHRVERCDCGRA